MNKKSTGGVKLSVLLAATKTITLNYEGEEIEFTFRAGFWTCLVERDYYNGEGRFAEKNNQIVAREVSAWNITGDDGEMMPITIPVLEALDAYLVEELVQAMVKAINPNPVSSRV